MFALAYLGPQAARKHVPSGLPSAVLMIARGPGAASVAWCVQNKQDKELKRKIWTSSRVTANSIGSFAYFEVRGSYSWAITVFIIYNLPNMS